MNERNNEDNQDFKSEFSIAINYQKEFKLK